MGYEEILKEITSKLSIDKEQNIRYLNEQKEVYKNYENGYEILKGIDELLYENSSGKKDLEKRKEQMKINIEKQMKQAEMYFKQRNFVEAKKALVEYVRIVEYLFKEKDESKKFSFRDILDFYIGTQKIKISKKMVWSSYKISWAYNRLSYIANEEKNYDLAIQYCDKALYYNPVDYAVYQEKIEAYKYRKDFEKMYDVTKESHDFIFFAAELSRYYRNLGYYYTEQENYELAFALYIVSIHFKSTGVAYHEIEYIKKILNNPQFILSKEKVLNILQENNIGFGIPEDNKNILLSFVNNKEYIEKFPSKVSLVNSEIFNLSKSMPSVEEILSAGIAPKTTIEDAFDENKLILDEQDKKRISKNIELLKTNNIPYIENMKAIPTNSTTVLKTKEEIFNRAIEKYFYATIVDYALNEDKAMLDTVIYNMNQKLHINSILQEDDWLLVEKIKTNKLSTRELNGISWDYEECAVLLWELGLFSKPLSNEQCGIERIDDIYLDSVSYDDLLSKCILKSKEEIMEFADLIFRYQWACRECKANGKKLDQLNESVVDKQRSALKWSIDWKLEKLLKEKVNMKYEKNDFSFECDLSTKLKFNKLSTPEDPTLLFTMTDNGVIIISLVDGGLCTKENFETQYIHEINQLKNEMYNILSEYSISSSNLNSEIKQIIANKVVPTFTEGKKGIIQYHFILNNYYVKLIVVLEDNTDYSNINNIAENSVSNKLAMDMLLTIKETNGEKKVMNVSGVDVPYTNSKYDKNVIMADSDKLFMAAIESSIFANLQINETDSVTVENVKNLYKIILTCGEYETPYIDENNLEEFLKDNNRIIELVRKFNKINETKFNNNLPYMTFDVNNETVINNLIDVLKKSFKKKNEMFS